MKNLVEYINEGLLSGVKNKIATFLIKGIDKLALTQVPSDATRQINMKIDSMNDEIINAYYAQYDTDKKNSKDDLKKIMTNMMLEMRFGKGKSAIDLYNMIWLGYFFSEQGRKDYEDCKKNADEIFTTDMMLGVNFGNWLQSEAFDGFKEMVIDLCITAMAKYSGIDVKNNTNKYLKQIHTTK